MCGTERKEKRGIERERASLREKGKERYRERKSVTLRERKREV